MGRRGKKGGGSGRTCSWVMLQGTSRSGQLSMLMSQAAASWCTPAHRKSAFCAATSEKPIDCSVVRSRWGVSCC